jgi:hypothetical protein
MAKLRNIIINWDNSYPWDLWWRKKYNIPFMSNQHKDQCLVASALEYIEFVELEKEKIKIRLEKCYTEQEYIEKQFGIKKDKSYIASSEQKISDEEFFNLDIDKF